MDPKTHTIKVKIHILAITAAM